MLTALKGNILEALSPDTLGIHPNSYLVLEDGRSCRTTSRKHRWRISGMP